MPAGFGNHHQTEAVSGALPLHQNSPLACPFALYAEQLSGSAFTRPRHLNLSSWLYRRLPSVVHEDYKPSHIPLDLRTIQAGPNPYRWLPFQPPHKPCDFIEGLLPIAGHKCCQVYIYQCNSSMNNRYFVNMDAEMLFVPYQGNAVIFTEFGKITLKPRMIAVIPRGVTFKFEIQSEQVSGYLCENKALPLKLPNLGPIGANGLANPRHFIYPEAAYEEKTGSLTLISKYDDSLWEASVQDSPLNVLAWHGNYAPYSYDLDLFNTINTVSFDHPDPSIFTVLTAESDIVGVADLDFVIFPPRWMVAEHTFRPPYFHKNIMSELMGLIEGEYDAKAAGFLKGGISLHNQMVAHGPDKTSYSMMTKEKIQRPVKYKNTLAFMFETKERWKINTCAWESPARELDYSTCWKGFNKVNL